MKKVEKFQLTQVISITYTLASERRRNLGIYLFIYLFTFLYSASLSSALAALSTGISAVNLGLMLMKRLKSWVVGQEWRKARRGSRVINIKGMSSDDGECVQRVMTRWLGPVGLGHRAPCTRVKELATDSMARRTLLLHSLLLTLPRVSKGATFRYGGM